MDDKQIDKLISEVLDKEQSLPAGLSDRLEQYIDSLAVGEQREKRPPLFVRRSLYWISGAVAALLIGVAIFFQIEKQQAALTADTYKDPQEAAIAAQKVLAFVSIQLNKGLNQVADAGEKIEQVNQIVNKTIKINNQ